MDNLKDMHLTLSSLTDRRTLAGWLAIVLWTEWWEQYMRDHPENQWAIAAAEAQQQQQEQQSKRTNASEL